MQLARAACRGARPWRRSAAARAAAAPAARRSLTAHTLPSPRPRVRPPQPRASALRAAASAAANAPPEPEPFFWRGGDTLRVPMTLHAENRSRLVDAMRAALEERGLEPGIVVLQGGREQRKYDTDGEHIFRQESFFQWAFGVAEPGCYGIISLSTGAATLLVPRQPPEYAVWQGDVRSPDWYRRRYGVDAAGYSDQVNLTLTPMAPAWLHVLEGTNSDSGADFAPTNLPVLPPGLQFCFEDGAFNLLYDIMTQLRAIKTPAEVAVMRYANEVTSAAHVAAMRAARPGLREFHLEAAFLHAAAVRGCRLAAYTPIAAAGRNGAALHYGHAGAPNDAELRAGDVALCDLGAEYHCYAADVTTTFPVSGKFSPLQAGVYGAVLAAQRAVLAAAAPGVAWPELHALAERCLLSGLVDAGLLRGDVEAMMDARLGGTFMPHGLGHLLGLDTHDVGGYPPGAPPRPEGPGRSRLRTARVLEEGMVITVEPGCYFNDYLLDAAQADPAMRAFLVPSALAAARGFGGVRLEDNVLVTPRGVESLTNVPRDIADVEAVMAGAAWP